MRPTVPLVLGALCAAAAATALAQDAHTDSVDLQVRGDASIRGTIRGAWERENFLLDLPQGASVIATAARRGRGRLVPLLDFRGDAGAGTTTLSTGTVRRGASSMRTAPAALSGVHRVRVFGDGTADGEYQARITVRPQRAFHLSGTAAGPSAGPITTHFAAPAGAFAKIRLAAPRGSGFVPALDALTDPDGAPVAALTGAVTGFVRLPVTGTYEIAFHDGGAAGGPWTCDVTLRIPRSRPASVNVSAAALTGPFVDDQPVYGRLAGDGADLVVDPPDSGGPLDGASISLEEGSLPFPLVLTMGEANPFGLPDGENPAGGAVRFGPGGTNFVLNATISLPFDANLFTDLDDLTVYVLDEATQEVTAVPKPYTFPAPGIVSFPTPHLSVYVPARRGPASPVGEWTYFGLDAGLERDWGGEIAFDAGSLTISANGSWTVTSLGAETQWIREWDDGTTLRPHAEKRLLTGTGYGTWSEPGGLLLDLTTLSDETIHMTRSRHGHAMVERARTDRPEVGHAVLLRRVRGTPTPTTIAGRWNLVLFHGGAHENGSAGANPVRLFTEAARGTAVVGADGRAAMRINWVRRSQSQFPSGTWTYDARLDAGVGSLVPSGREVDLHFPSDVAGERPADARMQVCMDGEVMVGVAGTATGTDDETGLVFLVREGTRLSPRTLLGETTYFTMGHDTQDRPSGVQGFAFEVGEADVVHDGVRRLAVTPMSRRRVEHDAAGDRTERNDVDTPSATTYTLSRTGLYGVAGVMAGVVAPSGRLVLLLGGGSEDPSELMIGIPGEDFNAPR